MTNIVFTNEPLYSEHEADAAFNERRKELIPKVAMFLEGHHLFSGMQLEITFLHTGISSFVCIVDTGEKIYILKIPLSILTSGLEGTFLQAWENVGVKVPQVFEEGKIDQYFFILMEYIEAETINKKYTSDECFELHIYTQLGKTLKQMHQVKSFGYSNVVNDKKEPEYATVAAWLANDKRTKDQFAYVKEHSILEGIDCDTIEDICSTIVSLVGDSKETVYCHNDFHTGNIFATEPYTVFDPWPCFNHPYFDIARSIFFLDSKGLQFIQGYFGDEVYDQKLLDVCIVLNIWLKLPYMYKTNKLEDIQKVREYLSKKV